MKNESKLAKRNLELSFEFSRYLLNNPELEGKIPEDALITFEVENDPELTQFNKELTNRNREANQPIVVVHISSLAPTRLIDPHVTLASR